MALYNYQIAAGNNNAAGLQNIEDVLTSSHRAPRATPVPLGSVREVMLDQSVQDNGIKFVTWSWRILDKADLDTLVTAYLGDYDTSYALVTIKTRKRDDTYANYNATLVLPAEGQDYQMPTRAKCTDVVLTFRNLVAL